MKKLTVDWLTVLIAIAVVSLVWTGALPPIPW